MSRLPHHISDSDLLLALESADDTETTEWSNDVPHFLSHFKFEQGTYKVRSNLLYKLYKLYSKAPLRQTDFSMTANQFIEYRDNYYRLNVKPMQIAKVVNKKVQDTTLNFNANLSIKKHFEKFIRSADVKKGKTWVEGVILHEIYRHYCIDNKLKTRMIYKNFIKVAKLYFKPKRIGSSKAFWFSIDDEIVSRLLTEEIVARVNSRRRVQSEDTRRKQSIGNKGVPKPKRRKNVKG